MTAVWPVAQYEEDGFWSWQMQGRCVDLPSDLFFPESSPRRDRRRREEQAKRICLECPVLARCKQHAVSVPERYGVWGATTPRERGVRASRRRMSKNSR